MCEDVVQDTKYDISAEPSTPGAYLMGMVPLYVLQMPKCALGFSFGRVLVWAAGQFALPVEECFAIAGLVFYQDVEICFSLLSLSTLVDVAPCPGRWNLKAIRKRFGENQPLISRLMQ